MDAIKVVDCLRFIKVNVAEYAFIRVAFLNHNNPDCRSAIYVHATDYENEDKIIARMHAIYGYEAPSLEPVTFTTDAERAQYAMHLILQLRALVKMITAQLLIIKI